jgi:hypothetical protein
MLEPTRPSVLDPVSRAIERTGRILFRPFQIEKWFVLGFCAWLAHLGEGGSGGGNLGNRLRGDRIEDDLDTAWDWLREHLVLILILASIAFVVGLVVLWIQSRGKFLFLEGVARNRAAVAEPWRRFAALGDSLFSLRLLLSLIGLGVVLVLGSFLLRDLRNALGDHGFGSEEMLLLVLWGLALSPLVLAAALVGLILEDLVVPIMWLRGVGVLEASKEALAFVSANLWIFVLYVLFKILLAIAIGLITCVSVCVTCCIVALPYLGVVILLPLYVFRRCYSIEFLAQFGPQYAGLAEPAEPP